MRYVCSWATILFVAVLAVSAWGQAPLRIEGESLSGKRIVLPDDAHGRIAFLIVGFTRKGGDASRAWEQRLHKDFGADSRYVIHPIAVLEDAPRLVRGIIKSGIRRGMPPAEQDCFVIAIHGEAELKRFVGYSAEDDAYLILIDRNGQSRWSGHGTLAEEKYSGLRDAAKELATK